MKRAIALILMGLALLTYPVLAQYFARKNQMQAARAYASGVEEMTGQRLDALWAEAEAKRDDPTAYEELLDPEGSGVMATLEIPKIRLTIPVYLLRGENLLRTIDLVWAGDQITLRWPERETTAVPLAVRVPVLYEDESLVVFNKPWDMPCHPVKKHQNDTLGNVFAALCAARGLRFPSGLSAGLDKDTTGIVVVAKDPYTASRLAGGIEKEYLAILCGCPRQRSGTIDAPIRRTSPTHILREVSPDGQRAVTHYEILAEGNGYSLARLWLETGRTHQIRVHMSYLGYPLAGDTWYGGDTKMIGRQALHCFAAISPPDQRRAD